MPTNRHIAKAEVDVFAGTLLDALNKNGGMDAILAGREEFLDVMKYYVGHDKFKALFQGADKTASQRKKTMEDILEKSHIRPEVVAVFGVLAETDNLSSMPRVYRTFNSLLASKLNTYVVDVTTRVPLDDKLRDQIKSKVSKDLGGNAVLHETVDPHMLGGIILSANDKRIDASLDTMLNNARAALKETSDTEVNARG